MDFNFPLILVIAVGVTGIIALYDLLFLRKSRVEALAKVDEQFKNSNLDDDNQLKNYNIARREASRELVVVEYAKSFFPVLAIVLVLRSFIVEPFQIPSESMVPTLEVGDFILVNKFTYGLRLPVIRTKVVPINEPKRGDVMVFFPPHETRYFIKRVIGLPGDIVENRGNKLIINGKPIEQEHVGEDEKFRPLDSCGYVDHLYTETIDGTEHAMRKCEASEYIGQGDGRWEVPEGHYFMMGDNRNNSSDSRVWGPVPEERIVGKAFAIWMHWDKFLSLPSFGRAGSIK